jgi:hypothetical protein
VAVRDQIMEILLGYGEQFESYSNGRDSGSDSDYRENSLEDFERIHRVGLVRDGIGLHCCVERYLWI